MKSDTKSEGKPQPKDKPKPKSPMAERAVVKPENFKDNELVESNWRGGIDHFDERV